MANSVFWPPSLSLVQFLVLLLGKAQGGQPQKMPLPKVAKFYGVGHVGSNLTPAKQAALTALLPSLRGNSETFQPRSGGVKPDYGLDCDLIAFFAT